MMHKLLFFSALTLLSLSCSGPAPVSNQEVSEVTLRQEYFANASYLGEVVATNISGPKNGLQIKLIEGADEIDPIKMVIAGQDKFGVCGADRIFTANEAGADLVVIGVVNYLNPTVFLSKKAKKINTPTDFEGHRVGVITGNNTEMIYRTLIRKAGVDPRKVKEIEIPFDLATFITDAYDVRPAYIFDETVSLDQAGIEYTIINPNDYGVRFIGTVYFTTRETVEKEPVLVQKFVNSIAEGWELALSDAEKALTYLGSYSTTINVERERLSFAKGIDYFRGENNKVLTVSNERWSEMEAALRDLGKVKGTNISFTNTTFIDNYHAMKKQ